MVEFHSSKYPGRLVSNTVVHRRHKSERIRSRIPDMPSKGVKRVNSEAASGIQYSAFFRPSLVGTPNKGLRKDRKCHQTTVREYCSTFNYLIIFKARIENPRDTPSTGGISGIGQSFDVKSASG